MAQVKIHKDGSVEALIGTQEIGCGSRTVAWVVASTALGYLPLGRIRVSIGDSDLPRSGGSGGSSTTGMIHREVSDAAKNAHVKLFELVAKQLGVNANDLVIGSGGSIGAKGGKSLSWEEACRLIPDVLIGMLHSPIVPPDRWYVCDDEGNVLRQSGADKYVS